MLAAERGLPSPPVLSVLCCSADCLLPRGERQESERQSESESERGCAVEQLVSDWTHSLTSCMEREGEREREGGRRGTRGDGEQTVAGSLTNQNMDEGIWV